MGDIKVAIDTSPLDSGHSIRGIGVHARELVDQLTRGKYKGVTVEGVNFKRADLSRQGQTCLSKYDIVHYPYFHPYFLTLPLQKPTKMVVTIHDLIPLIYPEHYPAGLKGGLKFLIQKLLLRQADSIITISETSKKDIVRFLGVTADKIHVVYLAPKSQFRQLIADGWQQETRKRYNLPERFVLYVGDVNYNKNLINLVKACKLVKIPLVIVGKQALEESFDRSHPENRELLHLIKVYGKDPDIKRLGFVPNEDLVKIYNLAAVYCQPSLYEGFGLPVLEAMACGCPVVVAKTQALVEIADGVAIFVNPKNVEDIVDGMKGIIYNNKKRDYLSTQGIKHVKSFSWSKVADETIKVYQQVV